MSDKRPPTTQRVLAIIEHMESLGAHTQAEEINALVTHRDLLQKALVKALDMVPQSFSETQTRRVEN